ncbi:FKBP-type peptidyl-prolyl cis-trans isomerasefamily protein, partial [Striga asiatica]
MAMNSGGNMKMTAVRYPNPALNQRAALPLFTGPTSLSLLLLSEVLPPISSSPSQTIDFEIWFQKELEREKQLEERCEEEFQTWFLQELLKEEMLKEQLLKEQNLLKEIKTGSENPVNEKPKPFKCLFKNCAQLMVWLFRFTAILKQALERLQLFVDWILAPTQLMKKPSLELLLTPLFKLLLPFQFLLKPSLKIIVWLGLLEIGGSTSDFHEAINFIDYDSSFSEEKGKGKSVQVSCNLNNAACTISVHCMAIAKNMEEMCWQDSSLSAANQVEANYLAIRWCLQKAKALGWKSFVCNINDEDVTATLNRRLVSNCVHVNVMQEIFALCIDCNV